MRIAILAALCLALFVSPVLAEDGMHFHATVCPQKAPCQGENGAWTPSDFAAAANQCVQTYLGYYRSSGYFENALPASDGCMALQSDLTTDDKKDGLLPHCCVVKLPDNSCGMKCNMQTGG